ncbi:hypothetical protein D3C73_1190210 [compost metagenome]
MDAGVGQLRMGEQGAQAVGADVVFQQTPGRQSDAQVVHGRLHAQELVVEHRPRQLRRHVHLGQREPARPMVHAARDLQQRMAQAVGRRVQPVAVDEARRCDGHVEVVKAMHASQVGMRHEAMPDQHIAAGVAAPVQEGTGLRAQLHVNTGMQRLEGRQARNQPLHRQRGRGTHAQHTTVGR